MCPLKAKVDPAKIAYVICVEPNSGKHFVVHGRKHLLSMLLLLLLFIFAFHQCVVGPIHAYRIILCRKMEQ